MSNEELTEVLAKIKAASDASMDAFLALADHINNKEAS